MLPLFAYECLLFAWDEIINKSGKWFNLQVTFSILRLLSKWYCASKSSSILLKTKSRISLFFVLTL